MLSPTPEPVARTSSYGTPSKDNDERLPPRPVAHGAAIAADAASPQENPLLVKRTLRVSHSSSATSAPPGRRGNGKRQKTTAAQEDLCCFCLVTGSCTSRNCPSAKAGRPCHSCDQGKCSRCTNMVEALNRVICEENNCPTSGIAARFQQRVGSALDLPLPLFEPGPPLVDNDNVDKLEGSENNNPPGQAELPINDQVDVSIAWTMVLPFVQSEKDDDDDDASPTALGLEAGWSNATTTSATALDRSSEINHCSWLVGQWERFAGGRRYHGCWFHWQ